VSCVTNTQSELNLKGLPNLGSPFSLFEFFKPVDVGERRRYQVRLLLRQLIPAYGAVAAPCFDRVEASGVVEE